jgi:hypothetical protein
MHQPQRPARQLTVIVLATILAAANSYLGPFAGMTIASAIPSAVVSMAILRARGGGGAQASENPTRAFGSWAARRSPGRLPFLGNTPHVAHGQQGLGPRTPRI